MPNFLRIVCVDNFFKNLFMFTKLFKGGVLGHMCTVYIIIRTENNNKI